MFCQLLILDHEWFFGGVRRIWLPMNCNRDCFIRPRDKEWLITFIHILNRSFADCLRQKSFDKITKSACDGNLQNILHWKFWLSVEVTQRATDGENTFNNFRKCQKYIMNEILLITGLFNSNQSFKQRKLVQMNPQSLVETELATVKNELLELKKKFSDLEKDLKRQ